MSEQLEVYRVRRYDKHRFDFVNAPIETDPTFIESVNRGDLDERFILIQSGLQALDECYRLTNDYLGFSTGAYLLTDGAGKDVLIEKLPPNTDTGLQNP